MIKVLSIFGTRPEAIKMAPLVKKIEASNELESVVCITAQHREMLDQVIEVFDLDVDYDLNLMTKGQTLEGLTGKVINEVSAVIKECQPNVVLVHGDTTTAMASALAAFYNHVDVGHVEAGLRTYNLDSPYPEELNRQIISRIAKLNFAPTEQSKENLAQECTKGQVYITGNTVLDALAYTVKSEALPELKSWLGDDKLISLTMHRRENLGEPMRNVFRALRRICEKHTDIKVVYPVHLNPKVQEIATEELGGMDCIKLIEPLDVSKFHTLLSISHLIITDSGGIQEEAPSLDVPVLVARNTTERPEGIAAQTSRLIGVGEDNIYAEMDLLLTNKELYNTMASAPNPYGDKRASERIVKHIVEYYHQ